MGSSSPSSSDASASLSDTSSPDVGETSPTDDAAALYRSSSSPLQSVQHLLHRYPTISPAVVLALASVVFTIFGHGRFQAPYNLGVMLQQTAVLATLAVGQTLIILTAGVDLAIGTGMLLTQIIMAKLAVESGVPGPLAFLIGAIAGLLLGAFHGFIVTKVNLPPFITTLGTFYIFQSVALVYSKAQTITPDDSSFLKWTGKTFGIGTFQITTGVLIALGMYLVFGFILSSTSWGRHVYATGDDREAARLAGIDTTRVLFSVYIVAGLIYAIGGWVMIGRAGSASTNNGADINLGTITAVVIGGTSLFGGRGRLSGTLIGALIVIVFQQGLSIAGVNAYYQNFAIGSLILIAVALDQWIRRVAK